MADISSNINNGSNKPKKFLTILNDNKDMKINSHIEEIDPRERKPRSFDQYENAINSKPEIMDFSIKETDEDGNYVSGNTNPLGNNIDLNRYLARLLAEGFITEEEHNEIAAMDYNSAMEEIDNIITEYAEDKAEYYEEELGIPATDEFIEILKDPNAEKTVKFNQYIDKHFPEFKEEYIESLITDYSLKFTDEEMAKINSFSTMTELQEYLSQPNEDGRIVFEDARYRHDAEIEAYGDLNAKCHAKTGYDLQDIIDGTYESDIDKKIEELESRLLTNNGVIIPNSPDNDEIYRGIENLKQEKERIKELGKELLKEYYDRIEFLINNNHLIIAAYEEDMYAGMNETDAYAFTFGLANATTPIENRVDDDGNPLPWNNPKIPPGDKAEVISYNSDTHEITYKYYDENFNEVICTSIVDLDRDSTMGNGKKYDFDFKIKDTDGNYISITNLVGADGELFHDGPYDFEKKYNMLAIARYYTDFKNSDDEKVKMFCLSIEDDYNNPPASEFSSCILADESMYRMFANVMTEEELRVYNKKFEEEGYDEARKYLENLCVGVDFQNRMSTYMAIEEIKRWANIKDVNYDSLTELTTIEEIEDQFQTNMPPITKTDEEGNIHYYIPKEGTIYIEDVKDGILTYKEVVPNDDSDFLNGAKIAGTGFKDGFKSFFEGIEYFFEESDGIYSVEERADMIIQQAATVYNYGQRTYSVSSGVGRALPVMIISKIPYVGQAIAVGSGWISKVGNDKEQTTNQGYTIGQAWDYAVISGTVDEALDVFTRSIPGLKVADKIGGKYFMTSVAKSFVGGAFGYYQDKVLRSMILNEDFGENFSLAEMFNQATTSAMVTSILNAYKIPKDVKFAKKIIGDKDNVAIGEIKNKYNISRKDAKKVYKLKGKYSIDDDQALSILNIMKKTECSDDDGIKLTKFKATNGIDDEEIIHLYHLSKGYNMSLEDALTFNKMIDSSNKHDYDLTYEYKEGEATKKSSIHIYHFGYTESEMKEKYLDEYNKNHPGSIYSDYEKLKIEHPEELDEIAKRIYKERVHNYNVEADWAQNAAYQSQMAEKFYIDDNNIIPWEDLDQEQKNEYINKIKVDNNSPEYFEIKEERNRHYNEVADKTIKQVEKLVANGYTKPGYNVSDILALIEDNVPPTEYLTTEYLVDWYKGLNVSSDGKVKLITLQNGHGVNFSVPKCKEKLGRPEGMITMPYNVGIQILEKCKLADGTIDNVKLTEALGGVEMSKEIIIIESVVDITDIYMPMGGMEGAFVGEWQPGGYTSGGYQEIMIPQREYDNPNSHISTIGMRQKEYYIDIIERRKK